jgi:hypothetical protein
MSAIRHSGHQPSELSARPPALTIGLPLALLGGLCLGGLALLELALALLGLGDLPPVVLQYAAEGLLARYLAPSEYAKRSVRPDQIGMRFHSQLFRNIVFACEMARELPWHVVNLVSSTQRRHADEVRYSFAPPTEDVCCYLRPDRQHCFTYRTGEDMHAALIRDRADLKELDFYPTRQERALSSRFQVKLGQTRAKLILKHHSLLSTKFFFTMKSQIFLLKLRWLFPQTSP